MASRRMFAKQIVDSDAFLDMPSSTQNLYFHLNMRADDEGFIDNPKKIMRVVGASQDDMNVLITKRFVIIFESGVIVIKHWKMHNYIRADRLNPTVYTQERAMLDLKENNAYTERRTDVRQLSGNCQPDVGIGKVRLDKDRLDKDRLGEDMTERLSPTVTAEVVEAWNSIGLSQVKKVTSGMERHSMLKERINEYGLDDVLTAIEKAKESDFLHGINKRNWKATFDWFIRPNNFPKVLEGNYDNEEKSAEKDDGLDDLFRKRAT